jgi:outer membrane receptor protein involved in Fe transport
MRFQGFSNVDVSGGWKRFRFFPGGGAPGLMAFEISALLVLVSARAPGTEILAPLAVIGDKPFTLAEQGTGAVTVLGPEQLAALPPGAGTYEDLLALSAGAYAGNPGVGTFSLRGLNQDNVFGYLGTGSNALINVMMDGTPLSPSTLRYLPPVLWDLAAAEVLRGPQLFSQGPNAPGGALLLQTQAPGFDADGKALTEFSQDGGLRFGLAQDFTLLPDELALRVSYLHQQSDGYETNLYFDDDEFGATRRDSLEARLRWHPAKNKDTTFDLVLVQDRSRGNPFAMVVEKPGGSLFQRETSLNTDSAYPADRLAATLNATVALSQDLELKSVTSVQRLDIEQSYDLDASSLLKWVVAGFRDETRFSEDLFLTGQKDQWQWLIGAYAEHSEYNFGSSGVGFAPFPIGSPFENEGSETVNIAALYGRGDWEFVDHFHLTGGLRLNHEDRKFDYTSVFGFFPPSASSNSTAETDLLPQLGLSWQPQLGRTFGIQVARGYRGGGTSYAPSLGLTREYDPEYAWDKELFARLAVTETLLVNAALFDSRADDQQVPVNVPDGFARIDTLIYNAASSSRQGAELETRWQAAEALSVTGSLAWVRTEFDSLSLNGVERSDQPFPNAPEWIASVGVDYHHATGWFGSALFSYADSTYSEVGSPQLTALEARQLVSARIGYAWRNASLYCFGSNLLDDDYALFRSDNSGVRLPVTGKAAPPRIFGIGVELNW